MKTSYIILSVSLLFVSAISFGQTVERSPDKKTKVNKGYYAIGTNAEKLNESQQEVSETVITPEVTKGYYSMKGKNNKLKKRPVLVNKQGFRPVVTKGYYAIGNNSRKLNTGNQ